MITKWSSNDAPSIFRIRIANPDNVGDIYIYVACPTCQNSVALQFARANIHSPQWWDERLVTAVDRVGSLWALEAKEQV